MPWVNPTVPATGDLITATQGANIANDLGMMGSAWTAYTPTLLASTSNPTLGTSPTQTGSYVQFGKTVIGVAYVVFGSSMGAGSGTYSVTLPIAAKTTGASAGSGIYGDYGTAVYVLNTFVNPGLNGLNMYYAGGAAATLLTHAAPTTKAAGDYFSVDFRYEIA